MALCVASNCQKRFRELRGVDDNTVDAVGRHFGKVSSWLGRGENYFSRVAGRAGVSCAMAVDLQTRRSKKQPHRGRRERLSEKSVNPNCYVAAYLIHDTALKELSEHTHTHSNTLTHTHTHSHTLTYIHSHIQIHSHTLTHTHTFECVCVCSLSSFNAVS